MVLASKVHPIPLKFLSKEGQNLTLCAATLNPSWQPGREELRHAVLNFDPLWGGISVGSEAMHFRS